MSDVSTGVGSFVRTVTSRLSVGVVTAVVTTVVVAGGIAWASVPNNSVNSAKIVDNTVQSADIRNNTVTGTDVKNSSLTGADVADSTLTGSDISDGSIGGQDLDLNIYAQLHDQEVFTRVTATETSVNGESSLSAVVFCPPGDEVLAGGGLASNASMVLQDSYPATTTSWLVRWVLNGGGTFGDGFQGTVHALCRTSQTTM